MGGFSAARGRRARDGRARRVLAFAAKAGERGMRAGLRRARRGARGELSVQRWRVPRVAAEPSCAAAGPSERAADGGAVVTSASLATSCVSDLHPRPPPPRPHAPSHTHARLVVDHEFPAKLRPRRRHRRPRRRCLSTATSRVLRPHDLERCCPEQHRLGPLQHRQARARTKRGVFFPREPVAANPSPRDRRRPP